MSYRSAGWIEVIAGPMCSGKSMVLLQRLEQAAYQFGAGTTLAIRTRDDTRGTPGVLSTRTGRPVPATTVRNAREALERVRERPMTRAVGLDEVQFYGSDIVTVAETLANDGVRVICSGLDTDCFGIPFGPMPHLLAIADKVIKRYAWCMACPSDRRQKATRTQYVGTWPPPRPGEHRPGGAELYEPRCRDCFTIPTDPAGPAAG